jgi:hypothetical protein
MNTQSWVTWWIPRVVKNILLNKNSIFWDIDFTIINPENSSLRWKGIKTRYSENVVYISWYFELEVDEVSPNIIINRYDESIKKRLLNNDYGQSLFTNSNLNLIKFYKNVIKKSKPDLIIINGTYIYPWYFLLAAKSFSIPIIIYYHWAISKEVVTKNSFLHKNIILFEKEFFNQNYTYIFPSKFLKKYVESIFWNKLNNTFIIPNSLPRYFFNFHSPLLENKKIKKIWFVMRWDQVKNKKFVIELVKYISINNLNYEVHLITDKPNSFIYKDIWVYSWKVFIKKNLEHEKLKKFFLSIDILVSPSIFESYWNVAQECIATKTLVLVSDSMWVKETLLKIWLKELVFDFKNTSIKDFFNKLDEISNLKITNINILLLYKEFLTKNINKKILKCFKKSYI